MYQRKFIYRSMSILVTLAMLLGMLQLALLPTRTVRAATTLNVGSGQTYATIQAAVDAAVASDQIVVHAGTYQETVTIGVDRLTITMKDGVTVEGATSCFIVDADYVRIKAETVGGAQCLPEASSPGIDVADGTLDLIIQGLEITGGSFGIYFAGDMTDVIMVDNAISGASADGIYFTNQPGSYVEIKGNLFKGNGGVGVEAPGDLDVSYNAWGDYGGPLVGDGDGVSTNISSYTPWTHADLYMVLEDAANLDPIFTGEEVTFTVYGSLRESLGVEVTISYPAAFGFVSSTVGGTFVTDEWVDDSVAGEVKFVGYNITDPPTIVSGEDLELFSFTLEALSVGSELDLAFIEALVSMAPPSSVISASSVILPAELVGIEDLAIRDVLDVTDADLFYGTDPGTIETALGGNFDDGFYMVLDPAEDWYYLDTKVITSNNELADGFYPFYLSGVANPIFYVKVVGTTYTLIDGYQYLNEGGVENPLRIDGTFTPGTYTYVGDLTDIYGTSDEVSIDITFVNALDVTNADLFYGTDPLVIETALGGNFTDGFYMVLDPAEDWYYLDTKVITSNNELADGFYPFYLSPDDTTPIFYVEVVGTTYTLIDGYQYLNEGGVKNPLRIDGTFTPGTYTYAGDLTDIYGTSTEVSIDITFITLYDVKATVRMQGRTVTDGVEMTLTTVDEPTFGPHTQTSVDQISLNLSFGKLQGVTYEVTTNQARYLDVLASLDIQFLLDEDYEMVALVLRAGDANDDNVVDLSDASIVGDLYGIGTIADNGDVNFDNRVNIQDLALVGGNYQLTSATAYGSWIP